MILVTLCLFLDCVSPIFCEVEGSGDFQHGGHTILLHPGREYLLGLQHTGDSAPADVKDISWSDFASQTTRKAKKQGSRGGVRNRVERTGENRLKLLLLKCCFTSTETVGLLGTGAQDDHLDFPTAPELWEQASTSCHYILQCQIAVEQNDGTRSSCEIRQALPPKQSDLCDRVMADRGIDRH